MKKPTQTIYQILVTLMSIAVLSLNTTLAQAISYEEIELGHLVNTGHSQSSESSSESRKSFVCNGNVVMAPEVIKRQLSCMENDALAAQWVQLLLKPSSD